MAVDGQGLLILGPSGSGKSSLAAQMIAFGAHLVSDDLTVLARNARGVICKRPELGPQAMELPGLGIIPARGVDAAPLTCCLLLQSARAERLPQPEQIEIFGIAVPVHRAVYAADLGAKMMVLMAGALPPVVQKPHRPLPHGSP